MTLAAWSGREKSGACARSVERAGTAPAYRRQLSPRVSSFPCTAWEMRRSYVWTRLDLGAGESRAVPEETIRRIEKFQGATLERT